MTYDEVKERITGLVSDPDKAAENATTLLSDLEKDYTTMTSMADKAGEQEKRIRDLQDTNQRLFLSVTGQEQGSQDEPEEEPGIDWDNIFSEGVDNGK